MKYRSRESAEVFDAILYDRNWSSVRELLGGALLRFVAHTARDGRVIVYFRQAPRSEYDTTLHAEPGDYITRSPRGSFSAMPAAAFEARFEPIEEAAA